MGTSVAARERYVVALGTQQAVVTVRRDFGPRPAPE